MAVVQVGGELLPQGFVTLIMVPGAYGLFEDHVLNLLRQLGPRADHGLAQGERKSMFLTIVHRTDLACAVLR
jgi:hypothetical protein